MTEPSGAAPLADETRLARAALMRAGESGDPLLGRLIEVCGPVEALAQIREGALTAEIGGRLAHDRGRTLRDVQAKVTGWRTRLLAADPVRDVLAGHERGARLVVPGDIEWPSQLDDLGVGRPTGLWVEGAADLRFSCLRSVAIVGARAATPYGVHVASAMGAELGQEGWTVISGGAYGVDSAAHRGALTAEAPTVAVLACGTDYCYPSGHHDLFAVIRERGVLISESPPGAHPTRSRFLIRNRLIAALSRGTVVAEAALRSGALNTVNHALTLHRHVGAVPGPVTSESSAGCHALLRQGKAQCVTNAAEVLDLIGAIGADLAPEPKGTVIPLDSLSPEARAVLDAIPSRGPGAGPATIAVTAGIDLQTALSRLGALAAAGYVQHGRQGWRLRDRR
ncbi:DNA-processing protein DprA [Spongiactinospora sp. 9N601]|uniref:DNA-processing protein DprA n=1 Tax=Spongiactinospora sp. 9N601 TaxID=3375149 RepID=UPI003788F74A